MKKIILNISEMKYHFFMELIKNFDFIHVEEEKSNSNSATASNIKQGFKELELYKKGKLKTTSAKDFLNEL